MNSTDKHIIQEHPQFAINGLFIIILFYLRLPVKFFLHSSKWYLTSRQYKFYNIYIMILIIRDGEPDMVFSIRHSSIQDSRIPLRLVYLGFQHGMEFSNYPNGNGFCMWYYCTEGMGEFTLDERRIIIHPGQCMILMPDTPYTCKALPGGCIYHLMGFTGPCCLELLRVMGIEEPGIYQVSDARILSDSMEEFVRLHRQNASQEAYSKLCYTLFIDIMPHLRRLTEVQPEIPVNDTIQMVIEYMEAHYHESISLDTLADTVHLTKEYLCVLFKKETGHTILHHLTLIRIGWARLFLEQYPDKKAYEIGKICGFDSPSYFGKKFREIVGHTPESYRRVNSIVV